MKRTILKGLILVALPLAILEALLRVGVVTPLTAFVPFRNAMRVAHERQVDFVFAGSSRVAAAIHGDAFASEMSAALGRSVTVVNLARGYSTLAEHYLALRRLYEREGQNMTGAVILVEAPEGVPGGSTFHDAWVHPDDPGLIVPLIDIRDLRRLWLDSETPLDDAVEVSVRRMLRSVDYLTMLRDRLLNRGEQWRARASAALERHFGRMPGTQGRASDADLTSAGGIRTDSQSIERARLLAVSMAAEESKTEATISDWSTTILAEMHRMVRAHGGRLLVFRMPLSSIQQAPYRTAARRIDARNFRAHASRSGIGVLDVSFVTTDQDFPDYWHLRNSRAGEFSQRVAEAYLGSDVFGSLATEGAD